jgi:hypothetical protein
MELRTATNNRSATHGDRYAYGSPTHRTNRAGVRTINSYKDCPECGTTRPTGRLIEPTQLHFVGYRNMPARRFETLNVSEIRRLMELTIDAAFRAHEFNPQLLRAYGALAAEFGFELWSRDQARLRARRACGRAVSHGLFFVEGDVACGL